MSQTGSREVFTAKELLADPLFAGVPPKFLLWQEGLAVRWWVRPGEAICRQGDPGNTAFLIRRGRLKVSAYAPRPKGVSLGKLLGRASGRGKPVFEQELTPA